MFDPVELGGDIVLNGVRYPLARDARTGEVQFRRVAQTSQDADAGEPVETGWESGMADGMGEVQRGSPRSTGYAFAERMDTSTRGLIRLAPRRYTGDSYTTTSSGDVVTIAQAPSPYADVPTFFFEERMTTPDIKVKAGSFVKSTGAAPASQAVTGVGFTPKVLILWTAGGTLTDTVIAAEFFAIGFTTGTSNSYSVSKSSQDSQTASNCSGRMAAKALTIIQFNETLLAECDLTSFDSDGFTLNWTTNNASAYIVHYLALAGADLLNAKIVNWAAPTSTGNKSVTGVGFRPDAVIHIASGFHTVLGSVAGGEIAIGTMQSSGEQTHVNVAENDNQNPTKSADSSDTTNIFCLRASGDLTAPSIAGRAKFVSMDNDGFTVTFSTAYTAFQVFSLCLKGPRIRMGSFTKSTGAAPVSQAVTGVGFSPKAVLYFGVHTSVTGNDDGPIVGATDGTAEQSSASRVRNNTTPSVVAAVDSTTKVYSKMNPTTTTVVAAADITSLDSDGFTINWTSNDTNATVICYVAIGNPSVSSLIFTYCSKSHLVYKLYVDSNEVFTYVDANDFGASGAMGQPAKFKGKWEIAGGGSTDFKELTTVTVGSDTYTTGTGVKSLGFTVTNDGPTSKITRGYNTNQLSVAATAPTTSGNWAEWAGASSFEVDDTTAKIVGISDSGAWLLVAKEDGVYTIDTAGAATRILTLRGLLDPDASLTTFPQTKLAIYSHFTGLYLIDGENITGIGPDVMKDNEAIPNVSYEPYRGRWYETAFASDDWAYGLYRVTESNVTRTYIMAIDIRDGIQNARWHTLDIESGPARGMYVDSRFHLWTTSNGQFVYRKLGPNGAPDAGRDSKGRGAVSTQHRIFTSETPFYRQNGEPVVGSLVQLGSIEIYGRNLDTTTPLQLQVMRDGAASENVGATITASGLATRYWTAGTNDTARLIRLILDITTTAGYNVANGDPQIWKIKVRGRARPNIEHDIEFTIDCRDQFSNGIGLDFTPPEQIRSDLLALEAGAAVTLLDPGGNSITVNIVEVGLMVTEIISGAPSYRIPVKALQRRTS